MSKNNIDKESVFYERKLMISALKIGAERKFGFCSDVRKIELRELHESTWNLVMRQNYINTDNPN